MKIIVILSETLTQVSYELERNQLTLKNLTLFPHASLDAFAEPAKLALVPVVHVDWAVFLGTARVGQVAAHAALEERLATFARELAVVLARALVAAHHTLDVVGSC